MYGTPVLGADIGGIPELIEVGKTGELFESGNAVQLKEKIQKLWSDRELTDIYSRNCKDIHFDDIEAYSPMVIMMIIEMALTPMFQFWIGEKRFEYRYTSIVIVTVVRTIANPALGIIFVLMSRCGAEARILATVLVEIVIGGSIMIRQFVQYKDAFGKIDGAFCIEVLKEAPFPEDILKLGAEGIREIWRQAKLRGRGYSRAAEIVKYAETSVGLKDGREAGKEAVRWFAEKIMELDEKLAETENSLNEKCREIPHAENVLEILGIGGKILSGILAEMGDISRFNDAKELQKLSGLGLVSCSSGKHKGETRISHRGRKRLRYWLFQAARSAVAHGEEYKWIHAHYTTRAGNALQKMQSLIAIACKLLRVIYTMLKTGKPYDQEKLLKDIRYPENVQTAAA